MAYRKNLFEILSNNQDSDIQMLDTSQTNESYNDGDSADKMDIDYEDRSVEYLDTEKCFLKIGINSKNKLKDSLSPVQSLYNPSKKTHAINSVNISNINQSYYKKSAIEYKIEENTKIDFIALLPLETSIKILLKFDLESLLNIRSTCKNWKNFVDQNIFWKRYFQSNKLWISKKTKDLENIDLTLDEVADLQSAHNLYNTKHIFDSLSNNHLNKQYSGRIFLNNILKAINMGSLNEKSFSKFYSNFKTASFLFEDTLLSQKKPSVEFSIDLDYSNSTSQIEDLENSPNSQYGVFSYKKNQVNWKMMYKNFYELDKRWENGPVKITTVVGHQDSVYCVQFDKKKIVTGSRDNTIKIWDIRTLQCLKVLIGHTASVLCLKYDNEILVTGSSDSTIIVWCMKTFQQKLQLQGHIAGVLDVGFNKDFIISCSKDCTIKLWDRNTGELVSTLVGHKGPVNAISLHESTLVSASGDTLIMMWDLNTKKQIKEFQGHTRGLACVQFDGKTIISGSNDNSIKTWDIYSGKCIHTLYGHTDLVRALYYVGGDIAISGSYDQTVKVWNVRKGTLLMDIKNVYTSWVFGTQFSKSKIISVTQDQRIHVCDFEYGLGIDSLLDP
ncbi:hypothetical protein BB561_004045 [Smittium simulii]|uniref:F-box domain-containing protein n=1 Tax=Smittium simulii TaxID=133385 RepID=A0A2T9YIH9_9FUNG|nr:hypothetical protein BB561_004045 [Smittium simulii]